MAQRFGHAAHALTGRDRDGEFTEYMQARLSSLRRLAYRLCQDWQRGDDLVQAAIIDLYVQWGRAVAADHSDGYARTILVRKYLSERRSRWFSRRNRAEAHAHPAVRPGRLGRRQRRRPRKQPPRSAQCRCQGRAAEDC
jgi:DNA-directed RNA polymerase specialized sigma24 family protein